MSPEMSLLARYGRISEALPGRPPLQPLRRVRVRFTIVARSRSGGGAPRPCCRSGARPVHRIFRSAFSPFLFPPTLLVTVIVSIYFMAYGLLADTYALLVVTYRRPLSFENYELKQFIYSRKATGSAKSSINE